MRVLDDDGNINIKINSLQSKVWNCIFDDMGELRKDDTNEVAVFGGFANGKSFIIMLITWIFCIKFPGLRFMFIRAVARDLDTTTIDQFKLMFPPESSGYSLKIQAKEAHFDNGSIIFFRGFDATNIDRILSTTVDCAAMCQAEEIDHIVFTQLIGRLRGKSIPKRFLLVEGNPKETWAKKRYKENPLPRGVCFFEAPTNVNEENLPPEYETRMREVFGDAQVDAYIEGTWDSTSNLVHPDFDEFKHVIPPTKIETNWFSLVGFDHGIVNPSAFLWISINELKEIHIWDEFYRPKASFEELVFAAKKNGRIPIVADYSIKRADRDGISLWDDLMKQGLSLKESNKDKKGNIRLINRLFHERRLFIHNKCENLIRELKSYQWKNPTARNIEDPKEEVLKKDDHAIDALHYGIRYLVDAEVKTQKELNYKDTLAGRLDLSLSRKNAKLRA